LLDFATAATNDHATRLTSFGFGLRIEDLRQPRSFSRSFIVHALSLYIYAMTPSQAFLFGCYHVGHGSISFFIGAGPCGPYLVRFLHEINEVHLSIIKYFQLPKGGSKLCDADTKQRTPS
jgi:hypothetical protein